MKASHTQANHKSMRKLAISIMSERHIVSSSTDDRKMNGRVIHDKPKNERPKTLCPTLGTNRIAQTIKPRGEKRMTTQEQTNLTAQSNTIKMQNLKTGILNHYSQR
jgi:hypothetical protein